MFEDFVAYRDWYFKSEKFDPQLEKSRYRISGIPYCARKIFFEKMGEVIQNSEYLNMLAHEGKLHHIDIQHIAGELAMAFDDVEIITEKPTRIEVTNTEGHKLIFTGSIDIEWVKEGQREIIDIKSVSTKAFWYLKKNDEAYQEHKDQLLMYGYSEGADEGKKPLIISIWYQNRDNGTMMEFTVSFDSNRVKELLDKMFYIDDCIRASIPPDKYSPTKGYECKSKSGRCSFFDMCYAKGRLIKFHKQDKVEDDKDD